jgi:hypothetical protein
MKSAKDLRAGDIIPPPVHERKWLKNPLTVLELLDGYTDKIGKWLYVRCSFKSPYGSNYSEMKIRLRPETQIKILQERSY